MVCVLKQVNCPIIGYLTVRPASAGDLTALAGDVSQSNLLHDRLRRRDADKGELLIASRDSVVVGHIYIWLDEAEEQEIRDAFPDIPLLMNLWVREDCRRRGVGRTLIREAEE